MPETPEVGSPRWWLKRLLKKLYQDQISLVLLDRYYRGNHPLPEVPPDLQKRYLVQFQQLLKQSKANFMRLVIDATRERLRVRGFRLSAQTEPKADEGAWRIWQANQLDAESVLAFSTALTQGRVYFSVWAGDEYPVIAVEDPCQTIVEHEPGNRRRRAAALKTWKDEWTGQERANVYLPNAIYKFSRKAPDQELRYKETGVRLEDGPEWEVFDSEPEVLNPFDVVPIVPMLNWLDFGAQGQSDIADVTSIQDRINGTIFNRVLAGWFTAFRQRWASGIEIPTDPETEQPIEPFKAAIDRLWIAESDQAKFGEFGQTDLEPYLKAHERDIQDIAVITRTPRHYLFQQGQSPSGDAIKSAETGLVAKVRDKQEHMAEALEEVIRLARRFAGESDAPVDSEIVWADPEYRSEGELTDAVIKQFQAGLVDGEAALERLGYTPTQIERMKSRQPEPEPQPQE